MGFFVMNASLLVTKIRINKFDASSYVAQKLKDSISFDYEDEDSPLDATAKVTSPNNGPFTISDVKSH